MDMRIAECDVPSKQGCLRQEQGHKRGLADARLPTDADEAALTQFDRQRLRARIIPHQQGWSGAAQVSALAELGQERSLRGGAEWLWQRRRRLGGTCRS